AGIQAQQHDVKGAIATYGQLLAVETNDDERAAVLDQMAKVYAVEKMNTEADATYRKAIADYPKVPTAHLAYGDYLAFIKDMAGAEREWTTAAGANRDYPEALARLGELYASKNDFTKQIDADKRWTEVASQDPRAFLVLGQAYGGHKDFAKAREAFRTSYALGHTPESLPGLAQADQEMHHYNECSTIYSSIDKAAPQLTKQNPQLLFLLGQYYQQGGDKKNARVAYTRFLPYLKAGSSGRKQVEDILKNLDGKPAAKPTPKPTSAPKK